MTAPVRGEGRTAFAGIILLIVGFFNAVYGIALIAQDQVVMQGRPDDGVVLIGDVTTWGWVLLLLGIVQVLAGLGLLAGQTWARVLGIIGAALVAIAQFPVFFGPHPLWSLTVVALCAWIIHGLVVYGEPA
jgi:hypothetical protein